MDVKQIIHDSTLYMHKMYDEPITIKDISAQAYLSPSYFSMLFRIFTGFAVKDYLNRYRLYCAATDLINSKKRIIEIAYANGFSSQQAFTRNFSQMYGIAPAQFRLLKPKIDPFPPDNIWKETLQTMELMECFENIKFIHKDSFFVAGLEADINYHTESGTSPISGVWSSWNSQRLSQNLTDQTAPGISYGITCNETAGDTGKYIVCAEVKSLDNLPAGLVGRKFPASDYAVFNTTLAIIWSGDFWRTFFSKWLPESGYKQPDESLHENYCTFDKYPAIEVYGKDFMDEQSIMQIYAPVIQL